MAIDLKGGDITARQSFLIRDDCLVCLTQRSGHDRVRRIFFDRVAAVIVWRRPPWGALLFALFLPGLPGGFMLATGETVLMALGGALLGVWAIVTLGLFWAGRTRFRIIRDDEGFEFAATATPRAIQRFHTKLVDRIEKHQASLAAQADESTPTPGAL